MKGISFSLALVFVVIFLVKCHTASVNKKTEKQNDTLIVFYSSDSALAGLKNTNGDTIAPPTYEYINYRFSNELAMVYLHKKYGFIDKTGKIKIKLKYNKAYIFRAGMAVVQSDSGWALIDTLGSVVKSLPYDDVGLLKNDSAYYIFNNLDSLYGIIDLKGNVLMEPKYASSSRIPDGYDGMTKFLDNGKIGFGNFNQAIILPGRYDNAASFNEGLAAVVIDNKIGFIDKLENIVIEPKYEITEFMEKNGLFSDFYKGLVCVHQNGKTGYINKKGNVVIPIIYDDCRTAFDFDGSFFIVQIGKKYGAINKNGKMIIEPIYDFIDTDIYSDAPLFTVRLGSKYGFVDTAGKTVISPKYDLSYGFREGVAFAKKGDKFTIINKEGKEMTRFLFDDVYGNFEEGIASVKIGSKYVFINKMGAVIVPGQFDKGSSFSEGQALVQTKGLEFFINKKGEQVSKPEAVEYTSF